MSAIDTNRGNITLPADVSNEIIAKMQEGSAVMKLARKVALPGRGVAINVITSDPEASWVGETEKKPVSNPGLSTKILRGYTLATIVPISNQFRRDVSALYEEIVRRIPAALGQKFDDTVFHGAAPGSDFDTLASVTAQSLASDVYKGLVDADTDIALHGGVVNGYVISAQGRGILLGATDNDDRPLFVNNTAEGAIPVILGAKTELAKAAFKSGSPSVVGYAGDWTQAVWGTVEDVQISIADQATLDDGNGGLIHLFQQNMFAIRAEIEVGFRADTNMFNALTATGVPSI